MVRSLLDKGVEVIACDVCTDEVDSRAVRKILNFFDLPEGNVFEKLGSPDVCLHMAWRNGFVHNAPTQMGDLSAHYRFLAALIDGGLKQLAVMGTMHEVGYWEGAIDENTPCNPISMYGIAKDALRRSMILYARQKSVVFRTAVRCQYNGMAMCHTAGIYLESGPCLPGRRSRRKRSRRKQYFRLLQARISMIL